MAYALDTLQERADLHVGHNDVVYEGMIVGENSRNDDMNVNPTKEKKLSNMRAAGHDRNVLLRPARRLSLEEALEFIEDDELVEVTPTQIRLRKILLNEHARKRPRGRRPRWGCDFSRRLNRPYQTRSCHCPLPFSCSGTLKRSSESMAYASSFSMASQRRPSCSATAPVVFDPANGSSTRSPGSVRNSMKNRGSSAGNRAGWIFCPSFFDCLM